MGINLNEIGMRKVNIGSTEIYKIYKGSTLIWPTLPTPLTSYTTNWDRLKAGETVTFTDTSTETPTDWDWTFEGGAPTTSTDQNKTVTYNTAGTYDVTFEASNVNGAGNTIVDTDKINVYDRIVSAGSISEDYTITASATTTEKVTRGNWNPTSVSGSTNTTLTLNIPTTGYRSIKAYNQITVPRVRALWSGTPATTERLWVMVYDEDSNLLAEYGPYLCNSSDNYPAIDVHHINVEWIYITLQWRYTTSNGKSNVAAIIDI